MTSSKLFFEFGEFEILHHVEDLGRRKELSPQFHANGQYKSIPLQKRTPVFTRIGAIPAELITLYPTGELRMVFPSSGRLTGFWTEEHEYAEAPEFDLEILGQEVRAKWISVQFHPNGTLRSATLWPKERITLKTAHGDIYVRIGISLHENGTLRNYEPAEPVELSTPIGMITAYDPKAMGVHGDLNSIQYNEFGELEALITMANRIEITTLQGEVLHYQPQSMPSLCGSAAMETVGMHLQFHKHGVQVQHATTFDYSTHQFEILGSLGIADLAHSCSC